jgi:hypothetical protein
MERLHYRLVEHQLPTGFNAVLYDGMVVIQPGIPDAEKVAVIAHEIYHHEFHGASVAFRELTDSSINRDECQAESFGVLVAEPSLVKYETMERFYAESALSLPLKKLRESLYYQIKF